LVTELPVAVTVIGSVPAGVALVLPPPLPELEPSDEEPFGLTATEARLAREIATGVSLREISMRLRISEGHARQPLKSVSRRLTPPGEGS
jgi:hypothetical protein